MPDLEAMLDAHVRFELNRWAAARLAGSVTEEVAAAFEWLADVTLADLAPAGDVVDRLQRLREVEITDSVIETVTDAVVSVRAAAATDDRALDEIVPREVFDEYVTLVVGMHETRRALIEQVTTSDVYSELIAHVLYHGIKNYLLSESPLARRVPGASSLMRLGQNALSSTGLDKGIDRQLTAFVNANISDSIRDSRDYLDTALDEELLRQVAAELWSANASATVGDAVRLISDDTAAGFVAAGRGLVAALRDSPSLWAMTEQAVDDFYAEHGARPVADLIAEAGVTEPEIADLVTQWAAPVVARAMADGYLERRVRARLAPFYESYRRRVNRSGPSARS